VKGGRGGYANAILGPRENSGWSLRELPMREIEEHHNVCGRWWLHPPSLALKSHQQHPPPSSCRLARLQSMQVAKELSTSSQRARTYSLLPHSQNWQRGTWEDKSKAEG